MLTEEELHSMGGGPGKLKDIVDILRDVGYGVVEGKDEVLKKIEEVGRTARRMPLEASRKPAGAFSEGEGYPPSQEVKYR